MSSVLFAIVGKPNVGKSSFFNLLLGKRGAIVDNQPGITRDRNVTKIHYDRFHFSLMDTGGYELTGKKEISQKITQQVLIALDSADAILFFVETGMPWSEEDNRFFKKIRALSKPVYFVVNKVDNEKKEQEVFSFYEVGVKEVWPISVAHNRGILNLLERIEKDFLEIATKEEEKDEETKNTISIAILGKPNAGKSSIVNKILKEERQIVSEEAGTTRDSSDIFYQYKGKTIRLIDTAGLRRKSRIDTKVEQYMASSAVRSIEKADIVLLVIDAELGAVEQDAKIAALAAEKGKPIILIANKWDQIKGEKVSKLKKEQISRELHFLPNPPLLFVSAMFGKNIQKILPTVLTLYSEIEKRIPTSKLNMVLERIITRQPPPRRSGKPTKIYYASQISSRPPTFVLITNQEKMDDAYMRHLENEFREFFGILNSPIKIIWRQRNNQR